MRLGSAPKFVMENQQYMSRARDGTTWLDWEIGESPLGYDIGYMGLAHPEVREYERSAFVSFARDFGADGVQMEFVQVLAEGDEVWPLGYDAPAIEAYKGAVRLWTLGRWMRTTRAGRASGQATLRSS